MLAASFKFCIEDGRAGEFRLPISDGKSEIRDVVSSRG